MKVELTCTYGDKSPGTVVDIDAKKAKVLIAEGNAVVANDKTAAKDSKEVSALKVRVTALESEVTTLNDAKAALESEVTTLKDKAK